MSPTHSNEVVLSVAGDTEVTVVHFCRRGWRCGWNAPPDQCTGPVNANLCSNRRTRPPKEAHVVPLSYSLSRRRHGDRWMTATELEQTTLTIRGRRTERPRRDRIWQASRPGSSAARRQGAIGAHRVQGPQTL